MYSPTYLLRSKSGIFYFRWPIPKQLHRLKLPTTLKVSLRTRDPQNALRLTRPLIQIGEELTDDGIARGMQYEELRAVLTRHFKDLLERKKSEIAVNGRLTPNDRERHMARLNETQEAIDFSAPIPANRTEGDLLSSFIKKYDLGISKDSDGGDVEPKLHPLCPTHLKCGRAVASHAPHNRIR